MALVFDREGRVRQACRNPLTLVGRDICASHIMEVWDLIPKYINEELEKGLGLRIPGLVTFGCKIIKNCSYPQMVTVDKYIHMVVSEDLVKMHGIKIKRPCYTLNASTNLNLSKITCDLNMPRYAVDACIKEVVHAFKLALATYRQVNFVFEGIGTLIIRDNIAKSVFDPCFMDTHGFGKRVMVFKHRFPCICGADMESPPKPSNNQFCYDGDDEWQCGGEDE